MAGCSEKSSTGPVVESVRFFVEVEGAVDTIAVSSLTAISFPGDTALAVRLSDFVDTSFVRRYVDKDDSVHDTRMLWAYRIIGEDGFNPHDNRGYEDNRWEHLAHGYYLLATDRIVFPDSELDLPGAFNVKSPRTLQLHRKLDIVTPDSVYIREIEDLQVTQVLNMDSVMESAVPLCHCIVDSMVTDPSTCGYRLMAVDGYACSTLTWEQLQTGYWLLSSQHTIFTDTLLQTGKYRLRQLEAILVEAP
jgi:hypothetical protein